MGKNILRCDANFSKLSSPNIQQLIRAYIVDVDQYREQDEIHIPLALLQKVYLDNWPLFHRLTIELGLRGYPAIGENTSAFYNNCHAFDDHSTVIHMISVKQDDAIANSIQALTFPPSLQSFLSASKVKTRAFFNGIIIENFDLVFPGSAEATVKILSDAGIIELPQTSNTTDSVNDVQSAEPSEPSAPKTTEIFDSEHDKLILMAFVSADIYSTDDITPERLQAVLGYHGIGVKKRNYILESLRPYLPSDIKPMFDLLNSNIGTATELPLDRAKYNCSVFPEIIIHSKTIRDFFVSSGQFQIQSTPDGALAKSAIRLIAKNFTTKKRSLMLSLIQSDINRYQAWCSDHLDETLCESQYRTMIKFSGFSKSTLDKIANLPSDQLAELKKELLYEYQFSLEQRLTFMSQQLEAEKAKKKNWQTIDNLMNGQHDVKYTLQNVGTITQLTRERVRQINKQILAFKEKLFQNYRIENICLVQWANENKRLIFKDEVPEPFLEFFSNSPFILFIPEAPFFIVADHEDSAVSAIIQAAADLSAQNEIDFDLCWAPFESLVPAADMGQVKKHFKRVIKATYAFKYQFGTHLFKRLSKSQLIYGLYYQRFGNNFSIQDFDYSELSEAYQNLAGTELFTNDLVSDKTRLLNNELLRLEPRVDGLLYIGSQQYTEDPSPKINRAFMDDMASFISQSLLDYSNIKVNKIYEEFKSQLMAAGVLNARALYFVLKKHLCNQFKFSEGNDLSISPKDSSRRLNKYILIEYLSKHGYTADKSTVAKDLGWKETSVEQVSATAPELIVSNGMLTYRKLEIPPRLRQFIATQIAKQTAQHPKYLLTKLIQNELKNEASLSHEITNHRILTDLDSFASLLRFVDDKWKGFSQILYCDEPVKFDTIVADKFGNQSFSKRQFESYFAALGYSPSTIELKLSCLKQNQRLAKVEKHHYILAKNLIIPEYFQKIIDNYLNSLFTENQSYVVLAIQPIGSVKLPQISNLPWTKELLAWYAKHSKSVTLLPWSNESDYRFNLKNPLIIVKKNDPLKSVLQLCKALIKAYLGSGTEKEIRSLLTDKNILIGNTSGKGLPSLFDEILYSDEENILHLRQDAIDD